MSNFIYEVTKIDTEKMDKLKDEALRLSKEFGKQSDKYESKAIRELKDRAERYNNEFWRCF